MVDGNVVEVDLSEWKFIRNDKADCGMYTVSQKKVPTFKLCNFVKS